MIHLSYTKYISIWPTFKTEMLIYQSNTNLGEKILFGEISHLYDPKIRKKLVEVCMGIENCTFHSGP